MIDPDDLRKNRGLWKSTFCLKLSTCGISLKISYSYYAHECIVQFCEFLPDTFSFFLNLFHPLLCHLITIISSSNIDLVCDCPNSSDVLTATRLLDAVHTTLLSSWLQHGAIKFKFCSVFISFQWYWYWLKGITRYLLIIIHHGTSKELPVLGNVDCGVFNLIAPWLLSMVTIPIFNNNIIVLIDNFITRGNLTV